MRRKPLVILGILTLAFACAATITIRGQSSANLPLEERIMMASRIYHIVSAFFPGLSQEKFDADYQRYVGVIVRTENRRDFDLASMAFVAELHDGHSWFYDRLLDSTSGKPTGFLAYPLAEKWTVVQSQLEKVHLGDVIAAIDDVPIDDFFKSNRRFVSASSDRDAGLSFFDTPVIFPEKFTLTLGDGRRVPIDRQNDKKLPQAAPETTGRWLVEKVVAYIKVPTFQGIEMQSHALRFLKEFHDAKTVILDVRGNPGAGEIKALQKALMARPYQTWTESATEHGGPILRNYATAYPEHTTVTYSDTVERPSENTYSGRLILLTDRVCSCACEDFVMPFKYSKRATLVGETTAGTFSLTRHVDYDNGMILNIAAVHHTFPDGSTFEGVGIAPDVPVDMTPDDWKVGRDPVLQKALELAKQP